MLRLTGLLVLLAAWGPPAGRADFPKPAGSQVSRPYPAVEVTAAVYAEPRPLKVWSVRIDLTSPDLDFVVTPRGQVGDKLETACETTLDFAKKHRVQLAINATPFAPLRQKAGDGMDLVGLSVSDGDVYSAPHPKYGALVLDARHRARILAPPVDPEQLKGVREGVGGFTIVLAGGRNLYPQEAAPDAKAPLHPRTAVGLSADGRTMWWLVIDGRQTGVSEGAGRFELAELGRQLGIDTLLNLDGGGSTTLALQDPHSKEYTVVNTPVGQGKPGTLRLNGNSLGLRVYTPANGLTTAQLRAIMPHLTPERAAEFLGPLNHAMDEAEITTPIRRAAFLAQLAHESGELRYMEEIASGEAYEGRKSLGNTEPGDGKRFKGRGPIQLTGRANYRAAGQALGLDLENHPELAAQPGVGCRVAAWYWRTRKLNALADAGDFKEITRKVNGGYRGLTQREKYYQKACEVLGVKPPGP